MCGGVVLLSVTAPATVEEDADRAGDPGSVRDEI
jgi:hypothetical protein